MTFTEADLAYIRANYVTLDQLCATRTETPAEVRALIEQGLLPRPSYVLDDGSPMFPADYFRFVDEAGGPEALCASFVRCHRAASQALNAHPDELERDWDAYLSGVYGTCLRVVTPESIVRKGVLVASLCQLLVLARPRSPEWRNTLRMQVDELDTLEREFTPDYERSREQERLPTRDLLIQAARERYPDVFADSAARSDDKDVP